MPNRFSLVRMVAVAVAFIPFVVYGQSLFLPLAGTLSIETEPAYPAPHETVTLRAVGNGLELADAVISWSANGARIVSGIGEQSAEVVLGSGGTEVRVEVTAGFRDGSHSAASFILRPSEVDVLWSANSYTPPFFRGRALPSFGTTLRAEALARLHSFSGSIIPPEGLVYTWRRDTVVLGDVSGRGKSVIEIPSPPLFGSYTLSVVVSSKDGASGGASVFIPSREPLLALYEEHPLFGVLRNAAVLNGAIFGERETTFTAVPYYADLAHAANAYEFSWQVNSASLPGSESEDRLRIQADGKRGEARIELSFSHALNWLQSAQGTWNIFFEPTAPSGFE